MEIERDVEKDIREYISDLNNKAIESNFNKIRSKYSDFTDFELLCYALVAIEFEFINDSFRLDSKHINAATNKTIIEWFIKMLLKRNIKKRKFEFNQSKYDKFYGIIVDNTILCANYLLNDRFKQKYGIEKFLIEINEDNEYYFKRPIIIDELNCKDNYYYNSALNHEEKPLIIINAIYKYIINGKGNGLKEFLDLKEVDNEIYNLCKKSIEVDIDKIADRFSSEVFKNKNELISIIGAFVYLTVLNKVENEILSIKPMPIYENPIIVKFEKLVNYIKKLVDIDTKRIENIIRYFTIGENQKWAFNEYPLINIQNYILWTPSSFVMNDFQFSIVNGHYEKGVNIFDRDKTVSRKLVNNIANYFEQFKNIVVAKEVKYHERNHFYKGKELDSDIDVAIYDTISNSVLIIECKWTEKLFYKNAMYEKICKYVKEIYNKQVYKHQYYLNIKEENINYVFNNDERILNRPYYPIIEYIMVDKRVQLHSDNQHLLSEFNLYELVNNNSSNGVLKLDDVISKIKILNTKVDYSVGNTISKIEYNGTKINNSIFNLI